MVSQACDGKVTLEHRVGNGDTAPKAHHDQQSDSTAERLNGKTHYLVYVHRTSHVLEGQAQPKVHLQHMHTVKCSSGGWQQQV